MSDEEYQKIMDVSRRYFDKYAPYLYGPIAKRGKQIVLQRWDADVIRRAYVEDPHLRNLSLKWWTALGAFIPSTEVMKTLEERGNFLRLVAAIHICRATRESFIQDCFSRIQYGRN